ncbi:hypothetical protein N9322_00005 [bacterium]|jgi:hypothetical protein|nr:hypothetical protein [bacterium]|tara:strand:+ start:1500 stop:2159 length:660 start_codon:yes stop_codon:yes gene_type:complete
MKLIIKFPTRVRVRKFLNVLSKYVRLLEDKSTPIIVSCDSDDISMKEDFVTEVINQYKNVTLQFNNNNTKIEAINHNMGTLDFDIVLLASDDMVPHVKGFDTIIREKMLTHYPDTDGVLWFNDGYKGDKLNTLCILGKKYFDRFGYIYNPEYKSVWCDNEFMDISKLLDKVTYFDDVIIRHEHPDWGFGSNDSIHMTNVKNESSDRATYEKRKQQNFGL